MHDHATIVTAVIHGQYRLESFIIRRPGANNQFAPINTAVSERADLEAQLLHLLLAAAGTIGIPQTTMTINAPGLVQENPLVLGLGAGRFAKEVACCLANETLVLGCSPRQITCATIRQFSDAVEQGLEIDATAGNSQIAMQAGTAENVYLTRPLNSQMFRQLPLHAVLQCNTETPGLLDRIGRRFTLRRLSRLSAQRIAHDHQGALRWRYHHISHQTRHRTPQNINAVNRRIWIAAVTQNPA